MTPLDIAPTTDWGVGFDLDARNEELARRRVGMFLETLSPSLMT